MHLLRKDVQAFGNVMRKPIDARLNYAITETRRAFRLPKAVNPIHLNDLFDLHLPNWNTSPGLPWIYLGYKTKRDVRNDVDAVNSIRRYWHFVKQGKDIHPPDCLSYARVHLSEKPSAKVRGVWGFPMTMLMGEAAFALPLIDAYRSIDSPLAYGYETALGGTKRIQREASKYRHFLCADFKNFDKTVPAWLIRVAFDILEDNMDFRYYQVSGRPRVSKICRAWDHIVENFINTRIRLPNGDRYLKHGAIPSGSYFTNLIGSICNHIILLWGLDDPPEYLKVFGDDSYVASMHPINFAKLVGRANEIGMTINMNKSIWTDNFDETTFLGYQLKGGLPFKPTDEWIRALLYPERPDKEWDDFATRALGIAYANLGLDNFIDNYCRRVVNLAPFDLVISRSFARFLRIHGIHLPEDKHIPSPFEFYVKLIA
jgi:hypothetical protein